MKVARRTGAKKVEPAAIEDGIGMAQLQVYLGFHLKMAQAAVRRDFIAALEGVDISQRSHAVLQLIAQNAHPSQAQVAAALQIDRATMMTIIDRLEDQGLVSRLRAAADRRRQELALTSQGRRRLDRANQIIRRFEAALAAKLTRDEQAVLVRALRKLYEPRRAGRRRYSD